MRRKVTGQDNGTEYQILTPKKLDHTFSKFHQNRVKTATVGATKLNIYRAPHKKVKNACLNAD